MSLIISYIPDWNIFGQAFIALLFPMAAYRMYKRVYAFVGQKKSREHAETSGTEDQKLTPPRSFSGDYRTDLHTIREVIGENDDLQNREFIMQRINAQASLLYINGMQNDRVLNLKIMEFLMFEATADTLDAGTGADSMLPFRNLKEAPDLDSFNRSVLFGHAGLLIEGFPRGMLIELPGGPNRAITEPVSEALLRGPRLGFSEVLSENTSMLRRQGFSDKIVIKNYRVGTTLQRDLAIAYIKDIVNPDLLEEVRMRISRMEMDFIADSGYVEQLIEDNYLSPFQQTQNTERPDRVINAMMEGRIAILLDGSSFALVVRPDCSGDVQHAAAVAGGLLRALAAKLAAAYAPLCGRFSGTDGPRALYFIHFVPSGPHSDRTGPLYYRDAPRRSVSSADRGPDSGSVD